MLNAPFVTAGLPGIGGLLRVHEDDFEVDEVAAYAPEGTGDHVFVRIEKRGVTTLDAMAGLARALGVGERDVGSAGLKDKRAVTRQWLSLPPPASPEAALALNLPGVRVLEASRHPHKLRTGHLRGNRFRLIVRSPACPVDEAVARARAILALLASAPGTPNWYGEQRFGKGGGNAAIGRALLRGEGGRRAPRGRQRRLYVSALQSELFNEVLRRRIDDGLYRRVVDGDILEKRDSGGRFASTETAVDQERLERGEVAVTGPMFGHDMRQPTDGSEAARREATVLDGAGLTLEAFRPLGKLAPGTRRPLAVPLTEVEVGALDDTALAVGFSLPAGAYATAVMREVMKDERPATREQAPAPTAME